MTIKPGRFLVVLGVSAWLVAACAQRPTTVPTQSPVPSTTSGSAITTRISRQEALDLVRGAPGGGQFRFLRIDRKEAKLMRLGDWQQRAPGVGLGHDPGALVWVVVAEGQVDGMAQTPVGPVPYRVGGAVVDADTGQLWGTFYRTTPWPEYWDDVPDQAKSR